jgi:hypothetical protein
LPQRVWTIEYISASRLVAQAFFADLIMIGRIRRFALDHPQDVGKPSPAALRPKTPVVPKGDPVGPRIIAGGRR